MQVTQFAKHTVEKETVIHKCFKRMPYIGTVFPFNMYFAIEVAHSILTRCMGSRESSKFLKPITTYLMLLVTQWDHDKIPR